MLISASLCALNLARMSFHWDQETSSVRPVPLAEYLLLSQTDPWIDVREHNIRNQKADYRQNAHDHDAAGREVHIFCQQGAVMTGPMVGSPSTMPATVSPENSSASSQPPELMMGFSATRTG